MGSSYRTVSEWLDEYENDVNQMLGPSQLPNLNPVELWEILEQCVRLCLPPHYQNTKCLLLECMIRQPESV